jgi:glycosidase
VNPEYHNINAQQQLDDPNSILNYYKKLISLRKSSDTLIYGSYGSYMDKHPEIFVYSRSLGNETYLIVLNFYGHTPKFEMPEELSGCKRHIVLSNYEKDDSRLNDTFML